MYGFKSQPRENFQERHFAPWGPANRYPRVDKAEPGRLSRHNAQSEPSLPGLASRNFSAGLGNGKAHAHEGHLQAFSGSSAASGGLFGLKSPRPGSAGSLISKPKPAVSLSLGKRRNHERDTYVISDPLEGRPSTFFAGRRPGNLPNVRPSNIAGLRLPGDTRQANKKRFSSFLEGGAAARQSMAAGAAGPTSNRRASCGIFIEAPPEEVVEHRPNDKLHCAMRAYDIDKEFYQQQLMQWRLEINPEELAEELNRHRASQFFDFMQADRPEEDFPEEANMSSFYNTEQESEPDSDASLHPHNGAGGELQEGAERFLPECFLDSDLSVDGEIPPHPSFSMAIGVELQGNQATALRELIGGFVEASKPSPQLDNEHVFRPTWCRFVLDCFVLRAPSDSTGWPSFHYAVRHFDSVSHPWAHPHQTSEDHIGPKVGSTMCVHIEQCCVLVSVLLGGIDDPVEGTRFFFDAIVPQVVQLQRCMKEDHEERLQIETPRDSKDEEEEITEENAERILKQRDKKKFEWLNQRKPTCVMSVKLWFTGLHNWRETVEHANSHYERQKHKKRRHAFSGFLEDMIIEPDTFHFVEMFQGLFKHLYQTYADMRKLQRTDTHGNLCDYHMRFPAFFRFCIDFGLFPLCSYEEIKRIYLGAVCFMELQQEVPVEPDSPATIFSPTTSTSSMQQRKKPSALQKGATTGKLAEQPKLPRGKSSPLRAAATSTQSTPVGVQLGKSPRSTPGVVNGSTPGAQSVAPKTFMRASSEPTSSNKTPKGAAKGKSHDGPKQSAKPAIDTAWVDKPFNKMSQAEIHAYDTLAAIHGYVRDRFQRVEDFFQSLRVENEGLVDEYEFLKGLQHMHLEHDLSVEEIREVMRIIDPDHSTHVDVRDLQKVCRRVDKNRLSRLPEDERDHHTAKSVQDSLFTKVNRHLKDPGMHVAVDAVDIAFGHACFMECILKIVMLHLSSSGCSVQCVAPTYMKCLWLISFLHFTYQEQVERHEELGLNQKRPWSQSSTRPTTSQESTRPATRETNRPAGESSASLPRRASKNVVEPFMFEKVKEDLTKVEKKTHEPGQIVSYTSPLEQLISERPNLFDEWPQHPKHPRYGKCSLCGRRPWSGWGSGMCHGCSVVDEMTLQEGPLYPIFERRRILRKYKDIKLLGLIPEPAASQSGSGSQEGSDAGSSEKGSAR